MKNMYKIMIADDEGIVIDALRFIIEKNFKGECMIESAKTGRQVIELADQFRPDIAFIDIQMPGLLSALMINLTTPGKPLICR